MGYIYSCKQIEITFRGGEGRRIRNVDNIKCIHAGGIDFIEIIHNEGKTGTHICLSDILYLDYEI